MNLFLKLLIYPLSYLYPWIYLLFLPTTPFQSARSANAVSLSCHSISDHLRHPHPSPLLNSAPSSTAPVQTSTIEELGINTKQIWNKTTSILNPFRVKADRSTRRRGSIRSNSLHYGIWIVSITRRKVAFRYNFQLDHRSVAVFVCHVQYAGRTKQKSRFIWVFEFDRLPYPSNRDVIDTFVVCSSRWSSDLCDDGSFCDLGDESLHQFAGGVGFLRQ